MSIQEITESAGVGFGSFHNHFDSKDALFSAALEQTLIAYGELRDVLVNELDDPAEAFCASFRLTGRLREQNPELMRLLLHSGTAILITEHGLRPRALADLARGRDVGRFEFADLEVAYMIAGSAMLGMLQLLEVEPDRDVAGTSDAFAERTLRMLGMTAEEAAELISRPLPELPSLAGFVQNRLDL